MRINNTEVQGIRKQEYESKYIISMCFVQKVFE